MKKKFIIVIVVLLLPILSVTAATTYTVKPGDSLWKIAVMYQRGVREIINANPQFKNPDLIYPGDKVNIPDPPPFEAQAKEVIQLVNRERNMRGLIPFSENWQLSRVARFKSEDMALKGYFAHNSPTYGTPFRMMQDFGLRYSAAAENIAMGQRTPQAVMNAWMNSPGHRANILSPAYTQIGVGVAQNKGGTYYWTQMFMNPY